MIDEETINEDWTKTTWDGPTDWRTFYDNMALTHSDVDQAVIDSLDLPSSLVMPDGLRSKIEAFRDANEKERDAMRPV